MMKNLSKNTTVAGHVISARSFFMRAKGLLGRANLDANSAMWIQPCNNVHTFFMQFPIDVVFVDSNLVVRALYRDLQPWRVVPFVWGAHSAIELATGGIERAQIEVGDQLNVVG